MLFNPIFCTHYSPTQRGETVTIATFAALSAHKSLYPAPLTLLPGFLYILYAGQSTSALGWLGRILC